MSDEYEAHVWEACKNDCELFARVMQVSALLKSPEDSTPELLRELTSYGGLMGSWAGVDPTTPDRMEKIEEELKAPGSDLLRLAYLYSRRIRDSRAWNVELAYAYAQGAVLQTPTSKAYELLGHICNMRIFGNYRDNMRDAREAYQKAVEIDPSNVNALQ